jgi:hypothetical protein
MITFVIVDS